MRGVTSAGAMAKVHEYKHAGEPSHWAFHCPACGCTHVFDGRWAFNGDVERPTFKPSLRVHAHEPIGRKECHSNVVDGKIHFAADSGHTMRGRTVDLPDWPGTA